MNFSLVLLTFAPLVGFLIILFLSWLFYTLMMRDEEK